MRKSPLFAGVLGIGLIGILIGIGLTVSLDRADKASALTAFNEGQTPPPAAPLGNAVQPVGFFGGLPSFADLAEKVSPSVVNISTTKTPKRRTVGRPQRLPRDPFDDFFDNFFNGGPMGEPQPQKSLGSGFIINSEGFIITNNHVVEGADEIQVLIDGKKKYDAKVVGNDPKTDLAVIKIAATGLPAVTLGDSQAMRVGDWVMAVGNPFGLDHTVTAGIISAKGRVIGAGPYDDFIQTDASINPGNSGGPLFNLKGEVIGVNTAIVASGQGIGFAIPINIAKDLVPQLISNGKVTRAWLGVGIQDMTPELAKSFGLSDENGALISNVFPGSPAEKAGIKTGDVVRSFEGKPIEASHDLPAMVAREPIGKTISLGILRDGKAQTISVNLGQMEQSEPVANADPKTGSSELGLVCRDLTADEAAELGLPSGQRGVVIVNVENGSQAESAGVQRGDVLLSVNNTKVTTTADYLAAARAVKKGELVRLYLRRESATIFLAFTK